MPSSPAHGRAAPHARASFGPLDWARPSCSVTGMIETSSSTDVARVELAHRPVWPAMLRGQAGLCPACGKGAIYGRYLKVEDRCGNCGTELHHHRADDAPPYFTMLIVGHVVIGGLLALERTLAPPSWVHIVVWVPMTILSSMWLLPKVKGALIALQWALRMHGFAGPEAREPDDGYRPNEDLPPARRQGISR